MRRWFFFWIEKLQIPPEERKAISVLMLLLILLILLNLWVHPSSKYDDQFYRELDREFQIRSQSAEISTVYDSSMNGTSEPENIVKEKIDPAKADDKKNSSLSNNLDKLSNRHSVAGPVIDINTANTEQLERLPGIGPVYAERIIRYRRENGPFTSTDQLVRIKGIGNKRLEKLKPFIKVN